MKKPIILFSAIALLLVILISRLAFREKQDTEDERSWFVRALRYEFTARVDTVRIFNEHAGRLQCLLTRGNPVVNREDSLKIHFKKHDMLYFLFKRSSDTIFFVLPEHIREIEKGDSVQVSSMRNSIQVFRNGKPVVSESLTEMLTGFSKPFFMKPILGKDDK